MRTARSTSAPAITSWNAWRPGTTRKSHSAPATNWAPVDLKANYLSADQAGANNKFEQINLGGVYTMGSNKFFANVQRNEIDNGARGNAWSLAYSYALSKRTNLYTAYGSMRNNDARACSD
jgi:predicted porin